MNYTRTASHLTYLRDKKIEESKRHCSTGKCRPVDVSIMLEFDNLLRSLKRIKELVPNEFEQDDLGNIL